MATDGPTTRKTSSHGPVFGGQIVQEDPREAEFKHLVQRWIDGDVDYETVRANVPDYYRPSRRQRAGSFEKLLTWITSYLASKVSEPEEPPQNA